MRPRSARFARATKAGLAASIGVVAACNAILGISDRAVIRSKGPGTPDCGDASGCGEYPHDGGPSTKRDAGPPPHRDASFDGSLDGPSVNDAEAGTTCSGAECGDVVNPPPPFCAVNQTKCTGNRLERCNATRTGFELVEQCEAGTCTGNNQLQCTHPCNGDVSSCVDDHTLRQCSMGGQIATDTACKTSTPFCVAGVCVECKTVGDCTSPDLCHTVRCTSGTCAYTVKAPGDLCSLDGGYCNANAECVACLDATTCRASGECFDPTCTATGSCGQKPKARGQVCANGAKKCDGAGACVECVDSGDCTPSQVCRGDGCVNAIEDIGLDTVPTGSDTPILGNWLYMFRLPALKHDATLHSFGVVGDSSSTNATVALVLYADDGTGNAPTGAGIAATQSPIPIATVAKEVNAAPGNQPLTAGATYWLGVVANMGTTLPSQADATNALSWRIPLAFGSTFPNGQTGTQGPFVDLPIYIKVVDTD